jgi:hypothetical protein
MSFDSYGRMLTAVLAVAVVGCSDPTSVSERAKEAYGGPLIFHVAEEFASPAPGPPVITLRLVPFAIPACGSFEGDFHVDGSTVTVRADRVTNPGCNVPTVGIGYRPPIDVPLPWGPGEYTLRFLAAGATVEYRLRIEPDGLFVEPLERPTLRAIFPRVVTPEFESIGRFPARWLHFNCFDGGRAHCAELQDRLVRELGIERVPFPEGRSLGDEPSYLRYRSEADFPRIAEITCAAVLAQSGYMILDVGNWLGVFRQAYRLPDGSASCHATPAPGQRGVWAFELRARSHRRGWVST